MRENGIGIFLRIPIQTTRRHQGWLAMLADSVAWKKTQVKFSLKTLSCFQSCQRCPGYSAAQITAERADSTSQHQQIACQAIETMVNTTVMA